MTWSSGPSPRRRIVPVAQGSAVRTVIDALIRLGLDPRGHFDSGIAMDERN